MVRPRKSPIPDGRANNGGARQGAPGQAYSNRSDMRSQAVATAPGQAYGAAAAQAASQKVVPLAAAPAPPAPAASPAAVTPGVGGQPSPPQDLYRPSERPGEHVMTGLPVGPGAGPEALPLQTSPMGDPTAIQIRAMLRADPTNQELANLVADLARG
jgi:hypothetical protein